MEVHRFEAAWIGVSLLLIVGFISTVAYGAVGPGVTMVDESGGTIANPSSPTESPNFREPGVYETDDGVAVYVVAKQFLFDPGTNEPIRIPADTRVTFYITSSDVIHGFSVPGTNINVMAIPGQVAEITVRFDEPGRYGIVCHEYCGAGHHTMEGLIRVVPKGQFEGGAA